MVISKSRFNEWEEIRLTVAQPPNIKQAGMRHTYLLSSSSMNDYNQLIIPSKSIIENAL